MRCETCGKWFRVKPGMVYQAQETTPLLQKVIGSPAIVYDVVDCPKCGAQIHLHIRIPKTEADDCVRVVRCKNCVNRNDTDVCPIYCDDGTHLNRDYDDFFCADGGRKDD